MCVISTLVIYEELYKQHQAILLPIHYDYPPPHAQTISLSKSSTKMTYVS